MEKLVRPPLVVQEEWILNLILEQVKPETTYYNDLVKKNFIHYDPPRYKNVSRTPIARITELKHNTPQGDLISVIGDFSHEILTIFPFYPTIDEFERRYNQRITSKTLLSVILIKRANLKFTKAHEFHKFSEIKSKDSFIRKFPVFREPNLDILVLEITEFQLFQHDQTDLRDNWFKSLRYIYTEDNYKQLCSRYSTSTEPNEQIQSSLDYDDVRSF